jgi:hypothetical protein
MFFGRNEGRVVGGRSCGCASCLKSSARCSERGPATSNSARSCRPIAAWMFRMTIDSSRECKRLFLCTELSPLPPSQFSIKGTKSAAAYLDPSKSEIRLGALLPVLWEGNETSYVRFRTIWIYSRDARQREPQASSPVSEHRMTITLRRLAGGEPSYAAVPQSITLAIHTNASGSIQMR